ncbi:MAG: hypothetical protein KKI02_00135 [Planctomycetes bacterium]|nr:hypothetical protein [Planctomycetota bacterium]
MSKNDPKPTNGDSRPSWLPWVRRRSAIERLDERYQRVLELIDAMRDHFEAQDCRAAEVTAGLERMGGTLDRLADTQQVQCEGIASIATRVNDAARSSAGLATMLAEMPASLQAQAQAVHAVARQMEATRAADAELTSSLQQFSHAADSLRDAGTAQVVSLQRLHETSRGQKESLQVFVRQQSRLLLIITIVVMVLGLGSIGALAAVVHMLFRGTIPSVT